MIDISALGGLRPVEPLDLDEYVDSRESFPLPPKGRYTVQAPPEFPAEAWGRSKANALTVLLNPTIVGGEFDGTRIPFMRVSAKQYERGGVKVSQLGDYLRACGIRGRLSDEQAQADAVDQTVNLLYEMDIDWRAYNKGDKYQVEGMERFPMNGDGTRQQWIEHPSEKDLDTGEPLRLRANVFVRRFVPKPKE